MEISLEVEESICYIFNCPVHGRRAGALCFRAFAEENRRYWQKYIVRREEAKLAEGELDSYLDGLTAGRI